MDLGISQPRLNKSQVLENCNVLFSTEVTHHMKNPNRAVWVTSPSATHHKRQASLDVVCTAAGAAMYTQTLAYITWCYGIGWGGVLTHQTRAKSLSVCNNPGPDRNFEKLHLAITCQLRTTTATECLERHEERVQCAGGCHARVLG
ncbi:unnamed protein product [Boreogadus saida]